MVHLFRRYLQTRDGHVCQYIEQKEEPWEEGKACSADALMSWALNKHTLLKSRNKWGWESAE
eukprot:11283913-Ditylum_brightwellii.AAC.1